MNPLLALTICSIFILYLLRLDRKQAPTISHTLWIPTIYMLIVASKPLSSWFGAAGDPTEGSPLDRAVLGGLLILSLIILVKRRFNWHSAVKENLSLILLIGYMLISISWSYIPLISLKRWIRAMVAVAMAFLVLTEREPREAMISIFRRLVFILIPLSVVLIKYYPRTGVQFGAWSGTREWVGVTLQKNGLGRLCMFSVFFLIWTFYRRWRGRSIPVSRYHSLAEVTVLIIALWLLKGPPGTYSATAVAALVAGLAFFLILLILKRWRITLGVNLLTVMMALLVGNGVVTVMVGGSNLAPTTAALGRDTTLTGRTEIWAELVPVFKQHPIWGRGFGSFSTSKSRELYKSAEAHSGYLEVLIELGFIGLLFFTMFFLSSCRKAHRRLPYDFDWASLHLCFLLMSLIHNIAESSFNSLDSHLTAVLIFLAVYYTADTVSITRVPLVS